MIKLPAPVTLLLLALMAIGGSLYMGFAVLGLRPMETRIELVVEMPSSGGLMETSPVTLRGIEVGSVTSIRQVSGGLDVHIELREGTRIPVEARVRIANLSAAGEQFLDFQTPSVRGPFLSDGARVPRERVSVGSTVAETLTNLDALMAALDPEKVNRFVSNLRAAFAGREDDFSKIIDASARFGRLLTDKSAELAELYKNVQILGDRFEGYGPRVEQVAGDISRAIPDVLFIVQEFERYASTGETVWVDPIGPLVDKLAEYCGQLCPDFSLIATLLEPHTRPLRPLRADIGELVNMLSGVFPGDSMRATVTIPGG